MHLQQPRTAYASNTKGHTHLLQATAIATILQCLSCLFVMAEWPYFVMILQPKLDRPRNERHDPIQEIGWEDLQLERTTN
ncbi:hypothetical protein ASPACDRAFT_116259 [Aspergillus aculeatus ATCC 16872]|uniref:Uncharacterized protein n=1 Tax=Aspergillus aculeatus (strain ATCC 16872 / CBS 172.66 / WB 5094) TaxID=690307 RepID=A0A1L9WZ10_ASPA1|nr:uncharacterized protein ASPACDRAFT_116259 [Aspergillus aculeatus ATCC 16872]OJK01487.1 hypothetical protein ASPACDRAFT_116259 [Aspergillus aculeatus ATCC 16872]